MMSAYGWPREYVLDRVTPAQAQLWAERIWRRKRQELVMLLRGFYLAASAAFAGGEQARAFEEFCHALTPSDEPGEEEQAERQDPVRQKPAPPEIAAEAAARRMRGPNPAVVAALERAREREAQKD